MLWRDIMPVGMCVPAPGTPVLDRSQGLRWGIVVTDADTKHTSAEALTIADDGAQWSTIGWMSSQKAALPGRPMVTSTRTLSTRASAAHQ